jgi:hypothetical protein
MNIEQLLSEKLLYFVVFEQVNFIASFTKTAILFDLIDFLSCSTLIGISEFTFVKFKVVYDCYSRRKVYFICRLMSYSCDKATKLIVSIFTRLNAPIILCSYFFLHFKVLLL